MATGGSVAAGVAGGAAVDVVLPSEAGWRASSRARCFARVARARATASLWARAMRDARLRAAVAAARVRAVRSAACAAAAGAGAVLAAEPFAALDALLESTT